MITFEITHDPYSGPSHEFSAGNGSLIRLAPVQLFFNTNPLLAIEKSGESSRTTHGHILPIDACRYLGALIYGAINGENKKNLLSPCYSPLD